MNKNYYKKFRIKYFGIRSRIIGTSNEFEDCIDIMFQFMKDRNFKSYYQRYYIVDGVLNIDVGSHTEHFEISRKDKKDITNDYYKYANRSLQEGENDD